MAFRASLRKLLDETPGCAGRFTPETYGTSILSVESQSQIFAKMLIAPALGFLVDWVGSVGGNDKFWLIATVGVVISGYMV